MLSLSYLTLFSLRVALFEIAKKSQLKRLLKLKNIQRKEQF
jgi:hypothetical protein